MKQITLKVFHNAIDAHLLRSKLESEGIRSVIINEHSSSIYPINNNSNGGIRLQINETDRERAVLILEDIESANYTDDNGLPMVCPNCASTEIVSGVNSTKGIRGILAMVSLIFLGILTIKQKSVYKCNNCGTEFKS